jgi:hypothetical protein
LRKAINDKRAVREKKSEDKKADYPPVALFTSSTPGSERLPPCSLRLFDDGKEIQSGNGPVKTGLSNTVLRSSTRQPIVELECFP